MRKYAVCPNAASGLGSRELTVRAGGGRGGGVLGLCYNTMKEGWMKKGSYGTKHLITEKHDTKGERAGDIKPIVGGVIELQIYKKAYLIYLVW